MKRLWKAFVLISFRVLLKVSRLIPLKLQLVMATVLGTIGYYLSRRYRNVGYKNLTIAYGDTLSHREKKSIVKRTFQHFTKAAVAEFPRVASMSREQVRKLVVLDPANVKSLFDSMDEGRGTVVLTGHFGNFEICARRFAAEGRRFSVVARIDENGALANIFNSIRAAGGYDVIGRGDALRPIMRIMKEAGVAALLPDQKSRDLFVPFFGTLVGTTAGPAIIALRTGARIVPVFCVRQPDDTHVIEFFPDIDATPTGDRDADVMRIMTEYNAILESVIRRHPEQWLWLHDRWRLKPPPEVQAKWEQTQASPSAGC